MKGKGREGKLKIATYVITCGIRSPTLPSLLEQTRSPLNTLSSPVRLYSNTVPPCSGTGQLPVPRCRDRSAGEGRLRGCLVGREGGVEGVMRVPQDLEKTRRGELKGYAAEALVVVGLGYGEVLAGIHGAEEGGRRGGAPLRDRSVVLYVAIGRIVVLTTFWTRISA
ncbi:hypothetical protein BJ165DRAFT_1494027, partial [Panaeolus papilionaceus]